MFGLLDDDGKFVLFAGAVSRGRIDRLLLAYLVLESLFFVSVSTVFIWDVIVMPGLSGRFFVLVWND